MFSQPSKSLRFAGLLVMAGMNLSMFTPPGPSNWNESSFSSMRAPASCSGVGVELSRGRKDITCTEETKEARKKAVTSVRVTEEVIKEEGKADRINRVAEITTEAGCDFCDVTGVSKSSPIVLTGDFNEIQNIINATINKNEIDALKEVSEKIRLKKAQDACIVDSDGEKLDEDEKFECKFDRIADMEEEDADEYFNKKLKNELEEMAMSSDPEVRAKALEKLGELDDADLSDSVKNRLKILAQSSQQMDFLSKQQQMANLDLQRASFLPDNNPLKQQLMSRAKNTMAQAEASISNQQQTMYMSNSATSAADLADMTRQFEKINTQVQEVFASNPALSKIDLPVRNDDNNNTVKVIKRGEGAVTDPQASIPTVAPNPAGQVTFPQGIGNGVIRGQPFYNTSSGSRIPQIGGNIVQNNGTPPAFQRGAVPYNPNGPILTIPQ